MPAALTAGDFMSGLCKEWVFFLIGDWCGKTCKQKHPLKLQGKDGKLKSLPADGLGNQ